MVGEDGQGGVKHGLTGIRTDGRPALVCLFGLLFAHAVCYGDWIVDDAAITFAYSRNLAEGHGLVAQRGLEPVEGFSNPLWMLAMAVPMLLSSFDPVFVPKLVGLACAGAAVWIVRGVAIDAVHASCGGAHESDGSLGSWLRNHAVDLASLWVVANPAFVIWCSSGLENGLTVLLVAFCVSHGSRADLGSPRSAVLGGVLGALIFANRPDGAFYFALYPALVLGCGGGRARLRMAATASLVALTGAGILTAWRWWVFGDVVPNTFHVKGEGTQTLALRAMLCGAVLGMALLLGPLTRERRVRTIGLLVVIVGTLYAMEARKPLGAVAGPLGWLVYAVVLWWAARRGPSSQAMGALHVGLLVALMQFCALPTDWMGEARFATPLVMIAPFVLVVACCEAWRGRELVSRIPARVAAVGVVAAVATLGVSFAVRARDFAARPTLSMSEVHARMEQRFDVWAEALRLGYASVLTPDVGGALWSRTLGVVDLGGLCDRRIGQLLGRDPAALADHVFEVVRPTFVMFHQSWTLRCGLAEDPRLAQDYVGVETSVDEWVFRRTGAAVHSGIFVRRDALFAGIGPDDLRHLVIGH